MLVMPSSITASRIAVCFSYHGTSFASSRSGIAPLPETVSLPTLFSSHVIFSPHVPEATILAASVSGVPSMITYCR